MNTPKLTKEQNIRDDYNTNLQILLRTSYTSPNWDYAETALDNLVELSNPNKNYSIECYLIANNLISDIQLATASKYLNKPTDKIEQKITHLNKLLTELILFNKLAELDSKEQIFYALDDLGYISYVTNRRINKLENLLIYSIELKQFDVAEYCLSKIQDELKHRGVKTWTW